jgi:type II secretory pathway pseudopilin PulG
MRDEAGFTLVETVAGLLVLVIALGLTMMFLAPLASGAPKLQDRLARTAALAQLQLACLRMGDGLALPPWWTGDCVVESPGLVRVLDIGSRHTTGENPRPDLLRVAAGGGLLSLTTPTRHFAVPVSGTVGIRLERDAGGRPMGIRISLDGPGAQASAFLAFSSPVPP